MNGCTRTVRTNGLYLLPHQPKLPSSPSAEKALDPSSSVALFAKCDHVMWHCRFGHLNMQSMQAQHTHGVPTSHALAISVINVSCDSCLLHKATTAPRNIPAYAKPSRPLLNMSSDLWGPVNVPSPHGLRYCLLVIDHHTHYMSVRFLKSKDDACSKLETILLDIKHLHARHPSQSGAFAPIIKFDSDSVLEAAVTRQMCARLGVGVQFSAPYAAHHMLGKAECPWNSIRDNASAILPNTAAPNSMWSCAVNTVVYLRNRTYSRSVGLTGGIPLTLLTSSLQDTSETQ
jgi:hypothetical protein